MFLYSFLLGCYESNVPPWAVILKGFSFRIQDFLLPFLL